MKFPLKRLYRFPSHGMRGFWLFTENTPFGDKGEVMVTKRFFARHILKDLFS